jgi:hypothetical protein
MRMGLVPFCFCLSALYYGRDVAVASVLVTLTTILYDDLELSSHWLSKNACNILGYAAFEIGATKVMGTSFFL